MSEVWAADRNLPTKARETNSKDHKYILVSRKARTVILTFVTSPLLLNVGCEHTALYREPRGPIGKIVPPPEACNFSQSLIGEKKTIAPCNVRPGRVCHNLTPCYLQHGTGGKMEQVSEGNFLSRKSVQDTKIHEEKRTLPARYLVLLRIAS